MLAIVLGYIATDILHILTEDYELQIKANQDDRQATVICVFW